jgi:uncharacterized beta-barrel protein YwiB (DUF1934 family)
MNRFKITTVLKTNIDDSHEIISNEFVGTLKQTAGHIELRYEEPDNGKALCVINNEGMKIHRRGIINSIMEFMPHETTNHPYATPQGTLNLEIETLCWQSQIHDSRGMAYALYIVKINGVPATNNELTIRWEPCN